MVTRRAFFAYTGATTLSLCAYTVAGHPRKKTVLASLPGGSLDPASIPKYATPLLIPPVMPRAGSVVLRGGKNADYYEISMRQFGQQILPAGFPATPVWGYGAVASQSRSGLLLHNAPSLTIEARLPEGWREWIGASEPARVSVLVASRRIEFPRGAGERLEAAKELRAERAERDRPPVWSGVVRSDFTELRLPPRAALHAPAP